VHRYGRAGSHGQPTAEFFARKRAEREVRKSHVELEERVRQRTAELMRAEQKLRQAQKLEAVGRLAGGIAHDFNNLLAVMLARCGLVAGRVSDPALRAEIDKIQAACQQAAALTRQLLAFSKLQNVERRPHDINRVVHELSRTLVPLIGEDVELVVDAAADLPVVEADRGQVEQAVMNLVVNARDAMPGGGTLTIRTRHETLPRSTVTSGELAGGEYLVLSVIDTGIGMDEETVSKVFDPFFTTKPEGQGTGLGLSTVYGILEQLGGAVGVISAPGRGTELRLYFPSSRSSAPSPTRDAPRAGARDGARAGSRVLLVEDQPDLRETLGDALTLAGFRVVSADGAIAALALLERYGAPDLMLTDLVMPGMGGRDLAEKVRARLPGVRVLFMSGYDRDAAFAEGHTPERDAPILEKPFTVEQLVRTIAEVMRGEPPRVIRGEPPQPGAGA
jgi:two-component system, cell cycle sensor histidine kinase and response regulator CckA